MTETIWLKAHNLLNEHGRTKGTPKDGKGCYCVGGAIAEAVTGNPYDMELGHPPAELNEALHKFADHVGTERWYEIDGMRFEDSAYSRVYVWNDYEATDEDVLKALMELHEAEVQNA